MTQEQILEKLRETMGKSSPSTAIDWKTLTPESAIRDLGFDSLAILDLVYDIQQDFGLDFQPEDLAQVRTVNDLIGFLQGKGA
jgi:acyl carrier protein